MLKRLFTLFFFLIFTFNTNAEIQKIVYIDIEKIMQQSVAGKNFIILLDKKHKTNISKFKKENEQKVNSLISESQAKIKAQEEKSKIEIRNATLDTVKAIVSRYIENIPSDEEINKKLN